MPGGFCIWGTSDARPRVGAWPQGDTHMSPDTQQQDHISKRRVVYSVAGARAATVRRDHEYRVVDGGGLTMDVHYPSDSTGGARRPAVLFVTGFPDGGAERMGRMPAERDGIVHLVGGTDGHFWIGGD